jgi:aminopeptidase N
MAHDLAPVVDYFSRTFGPLPIDTLRISPIPGKFGQGWPGLIYLSTLSYLRPDSSGPSAENYFRSLLAVHEIAHQWWGHVVIPSSYRDEWISEALASYSALLWLEQKDKAGPHRVHEVLDRERHELLEKHNDDTAEAAGPLALGFRLDNSRTPNGAERILYAKGPWVIHMLRQVMRDPKTGSDAAFFQFLRALQTEFTGKPLSTAAFRQVAERYVSPTMNAEAGNKGRTLEWFFEQWIYGSGIPELKIEARIESKPAATAAKAGSAKRVSAPGTGKITGTATLQGVEESWVVPAPIYVQTAHGEVFAGVVLAVVPGGADDPKFSLPLPAGAQKVLVDPGPAVLAIWK